MTLYGTTKVEFLLLREGVCRTGWAGYDPQKEALIVTEVHQIPCPVEELKGYLP